MVAGCTPIKTGFQVQVGVAKAVEMFLSHATGRVYALSSMASLLLLLIPTVDHSVRQHPSPMAAQELHRMIIQHGS